MTVLDEEQAKALIMAGYSTYLPPYLGAMLVDTALAGIVVTLVVYFWLLSVDENRPVKLAVFVSVMGSFATTIYTWVAAADTFVNNFGLYYPLVSVKFRAWYGLLDPISTVPVQLFFGHRAYRLSRNNKPLGIFILAVILASTAGSFLFVPMEIQRQYQFLDGGRTNIRVALYLQSAGGVVADVLITGTILLSLMRSKSEWADTSNLLKRLMVLSTETQLPPSVLSIIIILFVTLKPSSYLSYFFQRLQAKAYVTGFLWSLNNRINLRVLAKSEHRGRVAKAFGLNPEKPAIIQVNTETYVQSDQHADRPYVSSTKKPAVFRSARHLKSTESFEMSHTTTTTEPQPQARLKDGR